MFSDSFMAAPKPSNLEIGQVLGGAFGAIRRNWLAFLVLTVALYIVPYAVTEFVSNVANHADYSDLPRAFATLGRALLISVPLYFIFNPIFVASITWIVWTDAGGARAGLIPALRAIMPQLQWILLAYLAVNLVEMFGFVLLIVPGIMATLALWVALPACAVEGLKPIAAITRSLELTRGQRWRLLGLFLAIYFMIVGLGIILGLASMMAGFSFAGLPGIPGVALKSMTSGIGAAFGAACVGSAYVELRTAREGVGAGDVAAVFA
jgi:hypothetical protein